MAVDFPAEVFYQRLMEHGRRGAGHGDVVLKTVGREQIQQLWQIGNLHYARGAERVEGIGGDFAVADVTDDSPLDVIGREAGEADRARLERAVQRAETGTVGIPLDGHRVGAGLDGFHQGDGRIAAMENHDLVGIFPVIVVPIEERCRAAVRRSSSK